MPDREVTTIRELIYFQYAKIVGKAAFGPDAKHTAYGFIKTTFRNFVKDEKKWSDILREDKQLASGDKACVYCGAKGSLQWEHIVPRTLRINDRCPACDRIQGIHNQVWACAACNAAKGAKGLYRFMRDSHPHIKKITDVAPVLAEKKYLKTIFCCHQCKGTLDMKPEGHAISVMDLDLQ
jgi:hypothetical protein